MFCLTGTVRLMFLPTAEPGTPHQAHQFKTLPLGIGTPNCQFCEFPEMCGVSGSDAFPRLRSSGAAHRRVKTMLRSCGTADRMLLVKWTRTWLYFMRRVWPFVVSPSDLVNRWRIRRAVQ